MKNKPSHPLIPFMISVSVFVSLSAFAQPVEREPNSMSEVRGTETQTVDQDRTPSSQNTDKTVNSDQTSEQSDNTQQ